MILETTLAAMAAYAAFATCKWRLQAKDTARLEKRCEELGRRCNNNAATAERLSERNVKLRAAIVHARETLHGL